MSAKPDLESALAELQAAVKASDRAVATTLRPGASAAALAKLAKVAGKLPAELGAWFRWHDGQAGHASIGPNANDHLLPSAAAASAWSFLEAEGNAPWRSSWIPVMGNGAGDHVVYDREDGRLLRYFHDDKRRPKVAASLAAWAAEVATEWRRVVSSAAPSASPEGWQRVSSPTKKELAKKPAGTAYHFRSTSPALGKGIYVTLLWKRGGNEWFQAEQSTLESAWTSISNNQNPWDEGMPDGGAANHLAEEEVFRDGKGASHAGLFERHFAKPPFPSKKK